MDKISILEWLYELHQDACKDGDKEIAELSSQAYQLINK
jgi:hypothetical protein